VRAENCVRFENTEVTVIRAMMVASTMNSVLLALFAFFASSFRARAALQAEILALRHQLAVLHKSAGQLAISNKTRLDLFESLKQNCFPQS
jgi:hypothetical protein